jgi:hypothetical protein
MPPEAEAVGAGAADAHYAAAAPPR